MRIVEMETKAAMESPEIWWSKDTVALVTGSNKGIGLEIVRELAKHGVTAILTSRDDVNGKKAIELLRSEGLDVVYHQLDITRSESVQKLVEWLSQTYGRVDILINNAGISSPALAARTVLETNYHGTRRMIEAFLPLMKPGGRIVNLSSKTSDFKYLSNKWKPKLEDISTLTVEEVDEYVKNFLDAVDNGQLEGGGWCSIGPEIGMSPTALSDYATSKIALNAYSRIVAREQESVYVNLMCPGVTNTDMSPVGHPPEVGADTAVWLALLPAKELPKGHFFMDRKDVGFSEMPIFFHKLHYLQFSEINFRV